MAIRVAGVGAALTDILAFAEDDFLSRHVPGLKGGMELVDADLQARLVAALPPGKTVLAPGGSVTNTIKGLAALGLPTRMIGKVGNDALGQAYVAGLAGAGVDTARFKIAADSPSGSCLCLVTPDAERTMRTCLGASATLAPHEITVDDFAGCSHVYVEGYLAFNMPVLRQVFQVARQAGCRVALDLASPEVASIFREALEEALADDVEIVFANEAEAQAFTGESDPEKALAALSRRCPVAAVKLGARGSLIMMSGRRTEVPPRLVDQAVDTTGAGDLWAAGFLFGHLNGWPLEKAGTLASATSAAVVRQVGANVPGHEWDRIKTEFSL